MPRIGLGDITIVFEESSKETPRGAAIVLATLLESTIEEGICARLLPSPMSNTFRDTLFGGDGDYAGFAAKVDLGYAVGLYGPKTRAELHLIRKVRNQFAHYAPRSFAHPEVMKYCQQLTVHAEKEMAKDPRVPAMYEEIDEFNMRWRYRFCVSRIAQKIYQEIAEHAYHPPQPSFLP